MSYTNTMENRCQICGWLNVSKLCKYHKKLYMRDSSINGYRLKKRLTGSRYTQAVYHKSEIRLAKFIEEFYGKDNVCTSYHPSWAKSKKGVLLEFDILIKNKNILVEYNGSQHYTYPNFFHKTKKEFNEAQSRDKKKARLAKKNGYKLVIFKHDEPIIKDYVINKLEGKIK